MLKKLTLGVCLGVAIGVAGSGAADAKATHLTFTYTHDIQTNLIKEFPTGKFTAANSFATVFTIPKAKPTARVPKYNFWDNGQTLTIDTSIPGATHVYTLMNAYSPPPGAVIASVEFLGSAGADTTFQLTAGTNIRDFYQGQFANTINGTTTRNAFEVQDVQDAGGTGNVNTGLYGTYVVDEQEFVLPAAFKTQTLTQIIITPSGSGTPILLGATVQSVTRTEMLTGFQP
jgi:hypothetical protein